MFCCLQYFGEYAIYSCIFTTSQAWNSSFNFQFAYISIKNMIVTFLIVLRISWTRFLLGLGWDIPIEHFFKKWSSYSSEIALLINFLCLYLRISPQNCFELFIEFSKTSTRPFVPAGPPSRGGDVTVYVLEINQPSLPSLFILYLWLFLFLLPFHMYFIP